MSYEKERERMVANLRMVGHIKSREVVEAMRAIPRHVFVPESARSSAYHDTPLPIGEGQTISAPHMVGIMLERLDLKKGQNVFEVGGGSGYHAALVAHMVGEKGRIISMERIEVLAERARKAIEECGLRERVAVVVGDGSLGWEKGAPYDRIFITCASPEIPPPLVDQLKEGGKLLTPLGSRYLQTLVQVEKKGKKLKRKTYGGCVFVPLVGEYGFS
ncbi:MAG: protein-L-isoaspartate(D-aspartate) O-methyltransferase [Methanobacteriota archaeon]|nr:MAG: protein-L-isoaspartate(D-aspartate) O-methyltransferase [Euryarchaeota archaeon]